MQRNQKHKRLNIIFITKLQISFHVSPFKIFPDPGVLKAQTCSLTKVFWRESLSKHVLWTGVVRPKPETFCEEYVPVEMNQILLVLNDANHFSVFTMNSKMNLTVQRVDVWVPAGGRDAMCSLLLGLLTHLFQGNLTGLSDPADAILIHFFRQISPAQRSSHTSRGFCVDAAGFGIFCLCF